jgi:hypothetical protein
MIYGLGTFGFGAGAVRKRVRWYAVVAVLCLAVLLMILPNIVSAYLEHSRLEYMENCGDLGEARALRGWLSSLLEKQSAS